MLLEERISALENERSELLNNLSANIDDTPENEYTETMAKADKMKADIDKFTKLLNAQKASRSPLQIGGTADGQKALKAFDFSRFMQAAIRNTALDGVEAEMLQEGAKFFSENGLQKDGFTLPFEVFGAHSAGAADAGQKLITTTKGDFIESLKKYLVLEQLGVQYLTGLNGNIDFGASTTPADLSAKTEIEDAEEYTMNLVNRSLVPQRGAVFGVYSKQLMHQTSYNIQQVLNDELVAGMLSRAEAHAIAEVLANAGTTVAMGTNGAAITDDKAIDLLNALSASNSNGTNNAFVTNSKVRAAAQKIKVDDGSGVMLWDRNQPRKFLGENALVTNHAPSNLAKGTGANLSAIAYGDFSYLTIGFWGGVDLVVDPFSLSKTGQVQLVLNFFHDSVVRQPGNFATIKDIDA
jgi:HK97 family phage major capsid protein